MWEVVTTAEYQEWFRTLDEHVRARLQRAQERLAAEGPTLGRPMADTVQGSSHSNMKELRPTPTIRAFFAFDPWQQAVLLCGGDKTKSKKGKNWYKRMIRQADALFDDHLANARRPWPRGK